MADNFAGAAAQKGEERKATTDGADFTDKGGTGSGERFSVAPNGKRSNLTMGQWAQVRTVAFKAWFGDWERPRKRRVAGETAEKRSVSMVVDENGEPKVVYHGTSAEEDFQAFNTRPDRTLARVGMNRRGGDWYVEGHRA